jgi:hypothetical protein
MVQVLSSPIVPMFSLIESSFGSSVRRKGALQKEYLVEEGSSQRHVGNGGLKGSVEGDGQEYGVRKHSIGI